MRYRDTAVDILGSAEAALKELIGQALAAKAYGELAKVACAAEAIAAIRTQLADPASVSPVANGDGGSAPVISVRGANRVAAAAKRSGLPRFARQGDKLLKVAWSKKERRPYEHRAPQEIIQVLVEAIRKRKGENKLFQANDVLPLVTPTGEEYPSYQSYLTLAWLRHVGVVAKMGRKGYLLKRGASTAEQLTRQWDTLPTEE